MAMNGGGTAEQAECAAKEYARRGGETATAQDDGGLAVYVHFPYCRSRCPYCDFFRGILPKGFDEEALVKRYLDDLARLAALCGKRRVKSVFFGGGTPSLLSPGAVGRVLEALDGQFGFLPGAEISIEANPNTFEREKFLGFRKAGANRLSLGVQSLRADDLKFLGRTHSVDEALAAMELGAKSFDKFSIDLIYARPQQMWESWQEEIDLALSFGLKHISLYELAIEDGTVFARKNIRGADEETAAKLYEQTVFYLREKGLERYEVSNFAAGTENRSVHNLVYWQGGDYIGLGEGAHGRLKLDDGQLAATADGRIDTVLTPEERAEELVLMGLRIADGISAERFYQACGIKLFDFLSKNTTKKLAEMDLLWYDDREIKLTDKGFLLLDEIILELVR